MAHYGRLPYQQRLEHADFQASYHKDDVCGSSFHGLATTLEKFAQQDNLEAGLAQIKRCIDARKAEIEKRSYPDPAHNIAVKVLEDLFKKYAYIQKNNYHYVPFLDTTIIRYDDDANQFSINIRGEMIKGGKRRFKKITKKRNKSIKKHEKIDEKIDIKKIFELFYEIYYIYIYNLLNKQI
jgi:hypothetical protein